MEIAFHKMHGLGNDFVLIDMRAGPAVLSADQLRHVADRRTGIGCDQVLVLEPPLLPATAANYRIFNQDGSVAEHCGNGVRCVAKFLHDSEGNGDEFKVGIDSKIITLRCESNGDVRVDMGAPVLQPRDIPTTFDAPSDRYPIDVKGKHYEAGLVSMGNPHAVFQTDDVDAAPVDALGEALQHHSRFPNRVNVGFMEVVDPESIRLRVYERGAGETLACGTGACAAVVVGRLWGCLSQCVQVDLPGGRLQIEWGGDPRDPVLMTGPATYVFEGRISL